LDLEPGRHAPAAHPQLRHFDLIEQIRMTVQHFSSSASANSILVLPFSHRENALTPPAEDFGCLALVE
jgi:hypothetical protein